ncbi:hypothetical protein K488DRAFT_70173 [Vararia minispora EC-137]|uniref:Uncharacterized protein n=1 Tax=Vararia minispora EC-137 TaxID=1314806 RepID=A0ACB8QN07_9AGAM|nr:hypothetical protein K488DRAFT_70173 [Vararia minispora EC-137]
MSDLGSDAFEDGSDDISSVNLSLYELRELPTSDMAAVELKLFTKKMNAQRQQAVQRVKECGPQLLDLDPSLWTTQDGARRRKDNSRIRALLSPVYSDETYASYPNFPKLLFECRSDGQVDKSKPFRNDAFRKLLSVIFFGPGTLNQAKSSRKPSPRSNATQWGVTSVTPGAIALVAVIFYFWLSPDTELYENGILVGQGGCGVSWKTRFDLYKKAILRLPKPDQDALFDWFNDEVFGRKVNHQTQVVDFDDNLSSEVIDPLDQMLAGLNVTPDIDEGEHEIELPSPPTPPEIVMPEPLHFAPNPELVSVPNPEPVSALYGPSKLLEDRPAPGHAKKGYYSLRSLGSCQLMKSRLAKPYQMLSKLVVAVVEFVEVELVVVVVAVAVETRVATALPAVALDQPNKWFRLKGGHVDSEQFGIGSQKPVARCCTRYYRLGIVTTAVFPVIEVAGTQDPRCSPSAVVLESLFSSHPLFEIVLLYCWCCLGLFRTSRFLVHVADGICVDVEFLGEQGLMYDANLLVGTVTRVALDVLLGWDLAWLVQGWSAFIHSSTGNLAAIVADLQPTNAFESRRAHAEIHAPSATIAFIRGSVCATPNLAPKDIFCDPDVTTVADVLDVISPDSQAPLSIVIVDPWRHTTMRRLELRESLHSNQTATMTLYERVCV